MANKFDLSGRSAAVTGGAQGIGFAISHRLAESGARVAIWDLDSALAEKAAKEIGLGAIAVPMNVADADSAALAVRQTEAAFGKLDILVCNAGIAGMNGPVETYPIDEWKKVIDIDLNGVFYCLRAALPGMKARGYGRIVNIASIAGKEGNPNASAYSAAKAGVIALTKSAGKECAGMDIAVNCVTPAAARTAIFDQLKPEFIEFMLSKIPRGRFVLVEEIASMVAWLVSQENSFTTGGVFDISGGRATY